MNDYKYTVNLADGQKDYGKYTQYVDLHELYNKQKEIEGIQLGLTDNKENDYTIVPGINVIAGMTGHGKSMLGNSLAYKAVNDGLNVVYITLEVSKENMFYQMISIKSFLDNAYEGEWVSHSDIKKRQLTTEQEAKVFDKIWPEFKEMKGNLHILTEWDFDTGSTASLQHKLMEVEDYSKKQTGRGIDFLIVDYIQLFKDYKEASGYGEYSTLTQWVNDFRKMSLNYLGENREIPIVLLAQLNRDAWNEDREKYKKYAKNESIMKSNLKIDDDMPCKSKQKKLYNIPDVILSISQIAGCAEIAKAAKQVITIYSDENLKASEQCQIQVIKNRDGQTAMEPRIAYMNPKYYVVGKLQSETSVFDGVLDTVLDIGDLPSATL